MFSISVTLLAQATPIIPNDIVVARNRNFRALIIQNQSTTATNLGDSTVSATNGITLPVYSATTPPAPFILTPIPEAESLADWYLFGTAGQTVNILVIP